ncbi:MAG: PfkB family carbohydrate kinase [Candidatus Zixiibacteriota bacterium]
MKKSNKPDTIDCLGMGIIPYDLLFSIDRYPLPGMKIDACDFFMQGGGPVPNVAIGLSRLGFKTALIAVVGDDPFGKISIDELKRDRVDHRFVIIKKQPSALAAGWVEKESGQRTMVLSRRIFVTPADIKTSSYPIPKILHLDGRDMPATLKLALWAKREKIIVSFDIGSMRNDVLAVFPYVDHLVVADNYAFPFTKSDSARVAIDRLAKLCPGTIVVTEGIKGSTGRETLNGRTGEFVFQPAFKVKNIDTTGAGDCYHTGYLYGLLKGYSLSERMRYGSAAAALKCTRPGARSGIPTEPQLLAFLKSKPTIYR